MKSTLLFSLFTTLLIFSSISVKALEKPCSTDEMAQERMLTHPGYEAELQQLYQTLGQPTAAKPRATRTVSVVVHVVYNNSLQDVPDSEIENMMQTINDDFRAFNSDFQFIRPEFLPVADDVELEFCLDQVIRVQTTETCFGLNDDMKFASSGGSNAVNTCRFLNIWLCDLCPNGTGGGGTAGYAYLPTGGIVCSSVDGVVVESQLGWASGNGRTTTHEIGHYLGLSHPWGRNGGGCNNDDGIDDTPVTDGQNFGCDRSLNTCGSGAADLPDQIENYMDYSSCTNMFTQDQASVMNAVLNQIRDGLFLGNNCNAQVFAPEANFKAAVEGGCVGTQVAFVDQSLKQPTNWSWNLSGATPSSSTSPNPTVIYNTPGTYPVTLTASNSAGSDSETKTSYIVIGPPPGLNPQVDRGSCGGLDLGEIDLSVNGGIPPYDYTWSNGATTQDITNAPVGNVSVTVTDASGCTNTASANVPQEGVDITTSLVNPATDNELGSISVLASGGSSPYTYQWDNGSADQNQSGLEPGIYNVTITDDEGCFVTDEYNVPDRRTTTPIDTTATSIIDNANVRSLTIYPNPTNGALFIAAELNTQQDVQIVLTNTLGQTLYVEQLSSTQVIKQRIDVADMPEGVYWLSIISNKERVTRTVAVH